LLLLAPNLTAASFVAEAAEIPYQINNSDRIAIGTVSEIYPHYDYSIVKIKVNEWIYNPFSSDVIRIRTDVGTNVVNENEAKFTLNESVLLMLKDEDSEKQLFRVAIGEPGKHPASDREAVIQELIAEGKLRGENQTGNETNNTGSLENTETKGNENGNLTENKIVDNGKQENTGVNKQKGVGSSIESKRVPFISPIWMLAILLGAIMYLMRK
jgi:hypothetical protein